MEKHLSVVLTEMPLGPLTIKKINAELNEDLLGNNKYSQGKKEFLGVNVFRRLLNEAFDFKWSWEILNFTLMPTPVDPEYAMVVGRLYLPGLGFRDGIGTAKMDKKDNSAGFAIAGSNAFKNALKQSGFAASLLDEDWDEDLFEEDFTPPKPKKEAAAKPNLKAVPKEEKETDDGEDGNKPTAQQVEEMAELKEIYNIENNKQLLGLLQIWNKDLKSLKDVGRKELAEFLDYYDTNEDEFEDFDPAEVA